MHALFSPFVQTESFVIGDSTSQVALSTLGLVTLTTSVGLLVSKLFSRRPAFRHTVLLASLVISAFLPFAVFVGQMTGQVYVTQLAFPDRPTKIVGDTSVFEYRESISRDATSSDLSINSASVETLLTESSDSTAERLPANTSAPLAESIEIDRFDLSNRESYQSLERVSWPSLSWSFWTVYFVVAAFLATRKVISFIRLVSLIHSATRAHGDIQRIASELAGSRRIESVPRVLISDRIRAPVAVSGREPSVIFPQQLIEFLPKQDKVLADILLHEFAHLERNDHRVIGLQTILRIVYWPVPTLHYVCSALSRSREEICDASAAGTDVVGYGRSLLVVAEQISYATYSQPALSAGLGRGVMELRQRVGSLIDPNVDHRLRPSVRFRMSVASVAIVILLGVSSFRWSSAKENQNVVSTTSFTALLDPIDQSALYPATEEAKKSNAVPLYRRALAPAVYPGEELPLPDGVSPQFSGRVVDSEGNPIAGAKIYAVALSLLNQPIGPNGVTSRSFRRPKPLVPEKTSIGPCRARSDQDGAFAFDARDLLVIAADGQPSLSRVQLFATAEQYGPDTIRLSIGTSVKAPSVTFKLNHDDAPIRGRLLDEDGVPLDGAEVHLESIAIPRDFRDYLDRLRTAYPTDGGPTPRATIRGYWDIPGLVTRVRTDVDGWFEFVGIGHDRFVSFYASGIGLRRTRLEVVARRRDTWPEISEKYQKKLESAREMKTRLGYDPRPFERAALEDGQWQIPVSPVVSGRVVDRQTGLGVENMLIAGKASKGPSEKHASLRAQLGVIHARTDKHGHFEFTIPYGVYQKATHIAITTRDAPGGTHFGGTVYLPISDSQIPEMLSEIKIEVDQGVPYMVKVVNDADQPITGAEVFASSLPPDENDDEVRRLKMKEQALPAREIEPGLYQGLTFSRRSLIFINAPDIQNYRGAHLDESLSFVDDHRVRTANARRPIRSYDAIIPTFDERSRVGSFGSDEMSFTARLHRVAPLMLRMVKDDGTLVRNLTTRGFDLSSAPVNPIVRDGTIAVHALHPKRQHVVRFKQESLGLVGQTTVDGSMKGEVDVLMLPSGRAEGRLLNVDGSVRRDYTKISFRTITASESDSSWGLTSYRKVQGGKIVLDGLVPGQRYRLRASKGTIEGANTEFVIEPGQTLQLGDIVWKPK